MKDQGELIMYELLDHLLRTFLKSCRDLKIRRPTSALTDSWLAAIDTSNEGCRSVFGGPFPKTTTANRGPIIEFIHTSAIQRAELMFADEITDGRDTRGP